MNSWTEISAPRLTGNFRTLQAAAGPATDLLAVVKADAYGHGAELCAQILTRAGAKWLGVTSATEGARVRTALQNAGVTAEILVMSGFLPEDVPLIAAHDLVPVIWTQDHLQWLLDTPGIRVHVEVDTAMSRQGIRPGPGLAALLDEIATTGLRLDGVFTHFANSEQAASHLTQLQERRFEQSIAQVHESGLRPAWVHAGNSSTIDNPAQQTHWLQSLAATLEASPMVRTGIALYGYCLPIDGPASPHIRPALEPVMTWKARILAVRDLATGESVGYNARFTATAPMRIALLPVGYADGLRRELSSTNDRPGGWAIIHGQRAPILGRISMNLTVLDVTASPAAAPGDEAILLGNGITADDHAILANTIAYEILCGIHPCR